MLTSDQLATLRAVIDTVIPPDEFPGGSDAGVGDYLLGQLDGDLRALLPNYAAWLDAVDAEAQARHAQPFATLAPAAQHDLLAAIEAGDVATAWPLDGAAFFALVAEHCAEGMYSDPDNGGNRGGVAWRMVRFEVRG